MIDLKILDIPIELNGIAYQNSFRQDLIIDRTNLDEEFATQPEKFAYYAALHEFAKDKELRTKRELDVLEAQVDYEKRMAAKAVMAADPKAKFTEKMYESEVMTDPRLVKKHDEYLTIKRMAGILGVCREAFAQRKEALISIGANHRLTTVDTRVLSSQAKQVISQPTVLPQNPFPDFDTSLGFDHNKTDNQSCGDAALQEKARDIIRRRPVSK